MIKTALLLCLVGCTDQKQVVLGSNGGKGPQVPSFTPATAARQLAVDANSLYWLSWDIPPPPGWQGPESSLLYLTKSDKDGSNQQVIARTGFHIDNLYSDYGLRIDADAAYFTDSAFLSKARLDGSGVTNIVPISAGDSIGGMAIDDGMIYWTATGGLMEVPKQGGMPTTLTMDALLSGQVAVDANNVYWIGATLNTNFNPYLYFMAKNAGTSTQLAEAAQQSSMIADNSNLYYEATNVVRKVPGVGGPPIVMMSGSLITSDIAADANDLYVVVDYTSIVKIDKTSYAQTVLLQGMDTDPHIGTLAVDATDVYWSNDIGDISHVAK